MGRAGSALGGFGGLSIVAGRAYLKWGKDSLNLPTLLQYDCTIIRQYKASLPTSRVYARHHTIW